jgi:glycosyltransferase involved in cell wall biosynthesis
LAIPATRRALSAPDVHWMSLRPELEGLLFPSKLYGILAAGRPVIAVAAKRGEIATLVEAHGCGIGIEPGESESLTATISDLSRDPARCEDMGRRARALLDQKFTGSAAFEQWNALIKKVARVP